MNASGFIAGRLRFKGKTAMVSIAVSFLVMILAVAVSSGFRKELRDGVSSVTGDVQLTSYDLNFINEESSIAEVPPGYETIAGMDGVESITPVIYRAGIVKAGESIHGVLFKGLPQQDSLSDLGISIPSRLSDILDLAPGDDVLAYFVGDRLKMRRFNVRSVYDSIVQADDNLIIYASLEDLRRLNGWEEGEVSALEIRLDDRFRQTSRLKDKADEIGSVVLLSAGEDDDTLVATAVSEKYPQLFDWLNLIDFNVLVILLLMTVVAGFNMISGLLILLFRNIPTIGTLKSMGMTDRSIAEVFLRVSSNLVLKGMAIGNSIAILFCLIQGSAHIIKLNPENYFISYVPVSLNIPAIVIADISAYAVIMLLLLIPSLFISKIDPAQTVRAQ